MNLNLKIVLAASTLLGTAVGFSTIGNAAPGMIQPAPVQAESLGAEAPKAEKVWYRWHRWHRWHHWHHWHRW